MAVPKRKTTPSKGGKRRTFYTATSFGKVECKECGELKMPHFICDKCGFYNGRKVVNTGS